MPLVVGALAGLVAGDAGELPVHDGRVLPNGVRAELRQFINDNEPIPVTLHVVEQLGKATEVCDLVGGEMMVVDWAPMEGDGEGPLKSSWAALFVGVSAEGWSVLVQGHRLSRMFSCAAPSTGVGLDVDRCIEARRRGVCGYSH